MLARIADNSLRALTYVLKATVGLGKTRSLVDILPAILAAMDEGACIAIAEPTLKKADELRNDLIAAGVVSMTEIVVLRGREAEDPHVFPDPLQTEPPRMCRRFRTVAAIGGVIDDVAGRMCRRKVRDENGDEQDVYCPFWQGCAHIEQQRQARRARIIIVSHAALQVGSSELSEEKGRLVALIIDEDATRGLVAHASLPLENVWAVPADPRSPWPCREPNSDARIPGDGEPASDPAEHTAALKARYLVNLKAIRSVVEATRATTRRAELKPSAIAAALAAAHGRSTVTRGDRSAANFVHAELSFMAVVERRKEDLRTIRPDTSDETVRETVALHQIHNRFRLAGLWTRLREQVDVWARAEDDETGDPRDYCRSVMVDWLATAKGDDGHTTYSPAFTLHHSRDLKNGPGRVPTLILDADADPLILSRWVEIDRIETIHAAYSKVVIRQVVDRTGSMASMKSEATIAGMIGAAQMLATRHATHIRSRVETHHDEFLDRTETTTPAAVALFSTKAAIDIVRQEHTVAAGDARGLRTAALDAKVDPTLITVGHFGELRGVNGWQQCAGAVIAGRIELSADALEDHARAIWHLEASPLTYLPPASDRRGRRLVARPAWYRTKAGPVETSRTGHPDDRIDHVLQSIREAELRQAIGRIRPVQRPDGDALPVCEVWVLTSVPLGLDVEIDSLHEWSDLAADALDRVWAAGVIPDHGPDLAEIAGLKYGALRTEAHRRRAKRDIQAPRPGQPVDRMRSAYADILGRPGELDIGSRRMMRLTYSRENAAGELVTHGATVMVREGETRAEARARAMDVLERLDVTVIVEGITGEAADPAFRAFVAGSLETVAETAWWNTLPWSIETAGRWGDAPPRVLRH